MTPTEQTIKSLEGKELESILVDTSDNSLELRLSENGRPAGTTKFEGILELNYIPDFSDFGPWLIMDCNYESDLLRNLIHRLNLLWTEKPPAVDKWLDIKVHRLKMLSGDFELIVTFKKIKTGANNK